ncbi:MAG: ATP-binding cassette domain-containing protein [Pseudomonadota bacterium]
MSLLQINNISLSFGADPILHNISFNIEKNEKICLIGRNGEGKSSLLKIIASLINQDTGDLIKDRSTQISYMPQDIPQDFTGDVVDILLNELNKNNKEIEQYKIDALLTKMNLLNLPSFENLSGGLKRKVLLAKALITEPDILLLDEPTNHLDANSIEWLEEFLGKYKKTLLFITHDRKLIDKIANRILEIDRGRTFDFRAKYQDFLEKKEEFITTQKNEWERFDKKLASEEIWIRKGIRARRTRNEGRVRSLEKMRLERSQRKSIKDNIKLDANEFERSGKVVCEAKNISFSYETKTIFKNFSINIIRGDRIGIIGDMGVGKTTLINVLLGKLEAKNGEIKLGTNLRIVYFDQLRKKLDETKTLQENVGQGAQFVDINGRSRHIISYLQDFLFTPDQAKAPISKLSGGEKNRLMLAKLFTKSFNLLVMDEPTNDLDIETLELLEEMLIDYRHTLLLVSHDRTFINNTVTSILAFEKDGHVQEYMGGYDDYLIQRKIDKEEKEQKPKLKKEKPKSPRERKLTFKEKFELDELPEKILKLEEEKDDIEKKMADPEFYKGGSEVIAGAKKRFEELEVEIEEAYERWEFLEELASGEK